MDADRTPLVRVAFFATLALVAAFVVSAITGLGSDGDPGPDGRGAASAPDLRSPRPADTPAHADIRVEVLNGAGRGGLAREATGRLRSGGFDVVFFGNAGRFDHPRSVVVDRVGDRVAARMVAAALAIDSVTTALDSTLLLDVSVVLGDDWPPPEPSRGGWLDRARRWGGRDDP